MQKCIYCLKEYREGDLTNEHIISNTLGCNLQLKKCVCKECNSKFGYSLEAALTNGLEFFRQKFGIKNKKGKVPTTEWSGIINGQKVDFIWDRQKSEVPIMKNPIFISKRRLPDGRIACIFRTDHEKQAKTIEKKLKGRYQEVNFEQIGHKEVTVEGVYERELNFLISSQTLRCIAKFGFNYLCFALGKRYAFRSELQGIRKYIFEGKEPFPFPSFLLYDPTVLSRLQISIPNHVILLCLDNKRGIIGAIVVLLGMFYYYVILSSSYTGLDIYRIHTFDPVTRKSTDSSHRLVGGVFPSVPFEKFQYSAERDPNKVFRQACEYAFSKYKDFIRPSILHA